MSYIVIVDQEKCQGSGECVAICPMGVFELQGGKAVAVNMDECIGCESCVEVCPAEAISVKGR